MEIERPLILVGGGGHCKSVIEIAESIHRPILGILDLPSNVGNEIFNYKIIGTDENICEFIDKAEFLVTIGQIKSAETRIALHNKILSLGGTLSSLIASTAYVSSHAKIGNGSVVMHKAFINAGAKIGNGCIINTMANIEHDVIIGDYTHISTGAMINGNCIVGNNTFIGSQSVLANGIRIGDNCVFAAASMVRKDALIPGIYSGNPAILKIKNNAYDYNSRSGCES